MFYALRVMSALIFDLKLDVRFEHIPDKHDILARANCVVKSVKIWSGIGVLVAYHEFVGEVAPNAASSLELHGYADRGVLGKSRLSFELE